MKNVLTISGFALISLSLLMTACNSLNCLEGSGTIEERSLSLASLHSINLDVPADVIITQGPEQSITIKGQPNILDRLEADSRVDNGTWLVNIEGCTINFDLEIIMTMATLRALEIDGSGTFTSTNTFTGLRDLTIDIDGSGEIDFSLEVDNDTRINIDGSGEITLKGSSANSFIDINGSGKIRNRAFQCVNATVAIDGSGDCELAVSQDLEASIDGSGDICFDGSPAVIQNVSGSGTIRPCS